MEFRKDVVAEPEIIYEDENVLAINKPAGLLVHASRNVKDKTPEGDRRRRVSSSAFQVPGGEPTLVDWLLKKYPEIKNVGDDPETRPGIVHRLDKATSGVMLVAKNQKYFDYLKSLFQKRQIKKTYLALVWGKVLPRSGVIEKTIGIKSGSLKRSVRSEKMAKDAVTYYKVKKYFAAGDKIFSLLEVEPKTGRTHQVRVHLASIGHPVLGDRVYGRRAKEAAGRLMLHSLSLEFSSEEGRRIKVEAEPPRQFLELLGAESYL
jgi:23S rRNA pseudouridine1911/1915/1917 synthase